LTGKRQAAEPLKARVKGLSNGFPGKNTGIEKRTAGRNGRSFLLFADSMRHGGFLFLMEFCLKTVILVVKSTDLLLFFKKSAILERLTFQ
jgi:hypothetical protein